MLKSRKIGTFLLLLSSAIAVAFSIQVAQHAQAALLDFKAVFYASRCLIRHTDPYQASAILHVYRADGGLFPTDPKQLQAFYEAMPVCINLPTSLFLLTPFALLPWGLAHVLWFCLVSFLLTFAAFLVWDLSRDYSPGVSLFLICGLLINSVVLLSSGNLAGIVVSLCVVAAWCFFKKRYEIAGVLALGISLSLKPHDAGLFWLFLLLAGATYRKRALQSLLVVIMISIPAVLWVSHSAPSWTHELHANIATDTVRGNVNDPGPTSISANGIGSIIALQSALSLFRDNPHFYNPTTYAICGAILLAFMFHTLRARILPRSLWLAVGAIIPLTLLVTYHRPYDARLLLFTIPACTLLWSEGGATGVAALVLTAGSIAATGDICRVLWLLAVNHTHFLAPIWAGKLVMILLTLPAPALTLALCLFYLYAYLRPHPEVSPLRGSYESIDTYSTLGHADGLAVEEDRDPELVHLLSR